MGKENVRGVETHFYIPCEEAFRAFVLEGFLHSNSLGRFRGYVLPGLRAELFPEQDKKGGISLWGQMMSKAANIPLTVWEIFIRPGFLICDINPPCTQYPFGPLVASRNWWGVTDANMKLALPAAAWLISKVLCLPSRSLMSSLSICQLWQTNLLPCRQSKIWHKDASSEFLMRRKELKEIF